MSGPLLELEDIHVAYGKVEAVRGINLKLDEGGSPPSSGRTGRARPRFSPPPPASCPGADARAIRAATLPG